MEDESLICCSNAPKANHLCVLVHGFWGKPSHLQSLRAGLQTQYNQDELHILVAKRNANNRTYDGIEVGGERTTQEIEEELAKLEACGQTITRLSVVGYSLGGLIARYTLGLLLSRGWLDRLEPVNFTAFACPFLGVRTPAAGVFGQLWNTLGPYMLSASGRQLFLTDSFRDTGKPLLLVLTDPKSIFVEALRRFKHRSLYANAVNDRSAPWYTSAIARSDPFQDGEIINLNYMKGYSSVMLSPESPVQYMGSKEKLPLYSRFINSGNCFLNNIPDYALTSLLTPIAFSVMSINAGVQIVSSKRRVLLHNTSVAEDYVSTKTTYMAIGPLEATPEGMLTATTDDPASQDSSVMLSDSESPKWKLLSTMSQAKFSVLNLSILQLQMINELNDIGWNKYPVYISKVRYSHAAIVMRRRMRNFDEGKVVIKHWLDNEFEI